MYSYGILGFDFLQARKFQRQSREKLCVCVCESVHERGRDRETGSERLSEIIKKSVCVMCPVEISVGDSDTSPVNHDASPARCETSMKKCTCYCVIQER